jgi:hypothetical protein
VTRRSTELIAAVSVAQTHAEFQAAVVELAESLGWKVYHTYDSRRSNRGWPDLALVRGATMLFLELKTEKGTASDEQEAWIVRLKNVKFVHADVVRPSHWDQLVDILQGAKR